MLTKSNINSPEEHGSRLGFMIVLLFFVSIIAFAYYYLQESSAKKYSSAGQTAKYIDLQTL